MIQQNFVCFFICGHFAVLTACKCWGCLFVGVPVLQRRTNITATGYTATNQPVSLSSVVIIIIYSYFGSKAERVVEYGEFRQAVALHRTIVNFPLGRLLFCKNAQYLHDIVG